MFGFSRTTTAHHVLPLIVWSGLLFTPTFAWSEAPPSSPDAQSIVQRGMIEVGVAAGYLQGVTVVSGNSANRSAFYLLPRIGMVITNHLGPAT